MKQISWVLLLVVMIAVAGCAPTGGNSSGGATDATAAPAAGADVTFASAVQPIFEGKCGKCHVEESKGRLSLASLDSTLSGGKTGAVVAAGNAEESLLYQMVAGLAEKRMPPKGEPLSDAEIATIKSWIDGGAK